ncbi:hypothetical protein EDB80DRAFT_407630 [Ilyonectria destructans]|nr:hypothetical protein EDB80DRAFT_407630 [Ilyonectria destructans]
MPQKCPVIVCVERAKRPKLPGTRHGARCKRLTLCLKPPTTSPSSTPPSFVLRQATRAASPHGSGQRSGFRVVSLGMWLASTDSHWLSLALTASKGPQTAPVRCIRYMKVPSRPQSRSAARVVPCSSLSSVALSPPWAISVALLAPVADASSPEYPIPDISMPWSGWFSYERWWNSLIIPCGGRRNALRPCRLIEPGMQDQRRPNAKKMPDGQISIH